MAEPLLLLVAVLAGYVGFGLLALRQTRHRLRVQAEGAITPVAGPATAIALLLIAGVALWMRDGPAFGLLLWLLGIPLTAAAVAFTLSYQPRWLAPLLRRRPVQPPDG